MDKLKRNIIRRRISLLLGIVCLGLAYLGVALPGVPGTPFILLTAFFFLRSSSKMYNWLYRRRLFAKIIDEFSSQEKLSLKFKIFVIIQLWISLTVAMIWFVESLQYRLLIFAIGIAGTVFIVMIKKVNIRN